jgi:hypothetical protein
MSTRIVAIDPSTITTRLSGTVAGSTMPAWWSRWSAMTARPMTSTIFASVPVCQPMTAIVGSSPTPTYQPISVDRLSTSPESQVRRSPAPQIQATSGAKRSLVST